VVRTAAARPDVMNLARKVVRAIGLLARVLKPNADQRNKGNSKRAISLFTQRNAEQAQR